MGSNEGDALRLKQYVEPGKVDTVIFSSILHELYSYIETDGRRFNTATVEAALRSAYEVLSPGGRIIIRDGIMTEGDAWRRIRFLEEDGMAWLARYAADFQGRAIRYEPLSANEVRMPVNDAMEFLYTYTWGRKRTYTKSRSSSASLRLPGMPHAYGRRLAPRPVFLYSGIICRRGMPKRWQAGLN